MPQRRETMQNDHNKKNKISIKDLTFEKICSYSPLNERADSYGNVYEWVAKNEYGNSVAFGNTKAECMADARRVCRYLNDRNEPEKGWSL